SGVAIGCKLGIAEAASPVKPARGSGAALGSAPFCSQARRSPGLVAAGRIADPAGRVGSSLTISPIGVVPAVGPLAKAPIRYDTAPTSLPSTYTGLPLMPETT